MLLFNGKNRAVDILCDAVRTANQMTGSVTLWEIKFGLGY